MEATIFKNGSASRGEVNTDFLGDLVRVRLLRHATRMYHANMRSGTHSTLTRGQVAFSKRALFRQKGTGRARVRHPQATQCRKGGVPHGPRPRDYSYQMPKRARFEAMRSAVLSKFRDGEVSIIDGFGLDAPKTKTVAGILDDVGYRASCLIVTHERDDNLLLSVRNLRRVKVIPVEELNAWDVLFYRGILFTEGALEKLEARAKEKTDES